MDKKRFHGCHLKIVCAVCNKEIIDISDMVNCNDEFYVCLSCKDKRWNDVLKLLGWHEGSNQKERESEVFEK